MGTRTSAGSGNKPLGRLSLADRLAGLRRTLEGLLAADGLSVADVAALAELDRCILANEILGSKQALCVALLKDEAVIDRAWILADQHAERFGSLAKPAAETVERA